MMRKVAAGAATTLITIDILLHLGDEFGVHAGIPNESKWYNWFWMIYWSATLLLFWVAVGWLP